MLQLLHLWSCEVWVSKTCYKGLLSPIYKNNWRKQAITLMYKCFIWSYINSFVVKIMAHSTFPLFTLCIPHFTLQFAKSFCNSLNKSEYTFGNSQTIAFPFILHLIFLISFHIPLLPFLSFFFIKSVNFINHEQILLLYQ